MYRVIRVMQDGYIIDGNHRVAIARLLVIAVDVVIGYFRLEEHEAHQAGTMGKFANQNKARWHQGNNKHKCSEFKKEG